MTLHHSRESKPKRLRQTAKYVHNGGRFDVMKISRHLIVDGESINAVFLSDFSFLLARTGHNILRFSARIGYLFAVNLYGIEDNIAVQMHGTKVSMERLLLQSLIEWNQRTRRKPLMIYGARQVGKTYLIQELFANRFYPGKTIYVNFKFDDDMRCFVNGEGAYRTPTSNAQKILDHLSLRENRAIDESILLIFDEIQEALPAITSLKDFKERFPSLHVIASGSLVRIKLHRHNRGKEKFFYPVGALEELTLMPMNFEEYLISANKALYQRIVDAYCHKKALDDSAHVLALDYLQDYLLVGSLPESIAIFLESKSHVASRRNLVTVYQDYLNDIDLYDVGVETALRTRKLFENLYMEINRPHGDFRPSLFDEGKKVRDYITPISLLSLAEVTYTCKMTKQRVTIPLKEDDGSNYRIYCLDTGFLAYQSGINMADFRSGNNVNMGAFFENYIACELASYGVDLFYWKGKNDAEFEFLVKKGNAIIPIDVKRKRGSLASAKGYSSHNEPHMFVKVSANRYGYDETTKVCTIPLYSFFLFAKELDGRFS